MMLPGEDSKPIGEMTVLITGGSGESAARSLSVLLRWE